MSATRTSGQQDATALLRAAVHFKESATKRPVTLVEIREIAESLDVSHAVLKQFVAASHADSVTVPNFLARPSRARSQLAVKDGNLILEGPREDGTKCPVFH